MVPFLLALSLHLYTIVASVAPGDEDQLLCENLRLARAAPIPAYSANMRVLMDSWNYQNLLPSRIGAVWDQVDNDENNPSGMTTNVGHLRCTVARHIIILSDAMMIIFLVDSAV